MKRRIRIATAVAALGATCLFMIPLANGASAATAFDDYQMVGIARGLTFTFSFKNFLLEKILDVGVPHAAVELGTSGGGAARAEAAQLFPGDVIAGAAPGALGNTKAALGAQPPPFSTIGGALPPKLPGYSLSYYPPGQKQTSDSASDALQRELPSSAGPVTIDNSREETDAQLKNASASATTHRVLIANGTTPVLEAASIRSTSVAKANGKLVQQISRTEIHDLTITLPDLVIKVGSVVTQATSSSDAKTPDGDASITVSDVRVLTGGMTYSATIDGKGIHVASVIPADAPSSLDQNLGLDLSTVTKGIASAGVSIRTGSVTKIIEDDSAETSVAGLVIAFTGEIPRLPPAAGIAVEAIQPIVDAVFPTYCPYRGKLPNPPFEDRDIPPQFADIFKQLPVCVSPNLIPGPGVAPVTTVSLGSVDSLSVASPAFVFEPGISPPINPPVDVPGGSIPPSGDFVIPPGGDTPPVGGGTASQQRPLYGRVARMPAGALLGSGLAFLIVAVAVAVGPSLRRWREAI